MAYFIGININNVSVSKSVTTSGEKKYMFMF